MSEKEHHPFYHKLEASAVWAVLGILLLFGSAIATVLVAPKFVDKSWTAPSSYYQVQMYEIADANFYISSIYKGANTLELVHHLKQGQSLLAFVESETFKIVAPAALEQYITHKDAQETKLTTKLLFLRKPLNTKEFNAIAAADTLRRKLQAEQKAAGIELLLDYDIYELYDPKQQEGFSVAEGDGVFEHFIDQNYTILEGKEQQFFHKDPGVIYVVNPLEYRVIPFDNEGRLGWRYSPAGRPVSDLQELRSEKLGFRSRRELIALGEQIFAQEGCWYCHTDQTRTLVQDVVLNGSDSYPAPPSAPNEYIYQKVTFAGTRRIGPDISRVGIKRPSRDWHKSHFWAPQSESLGSIMPAFKHFFDDNPSGGKISNVGIPNYRFEAIFQYLMTKGTRITPPTQAWWLGKDPVKTLEIIEGHKVVKS